MRIGVAGGPGRMGRIVLELARAAGEETLAFSRPGAAPPSGVELTDRAQALATAEVIIDFSTAEASAELARAAAQAGRPPLVIGTTGATAAEDRAVAAAAGVIPVVRSGNFSLGVNVMAALAEMAAARLAAADWDVDIAEAHHREKRDAPSGTAMMLGEAVARGRGASLQQRRLPPLGERASASRPAGGIAFSSVRAGNLVGEHTVLFASQDETLTLAHSARDRRIFAKGALAAARWIVGKPPGLYDMADVLGLR
ncbi:MAG TPA: 4-hydroxy-tetrahydrodipicolinate reductase [Caulobacteraceae bacterium]|nr:4-hydroxy-tetrahydrodipicolinate reductase [Caulobacteraceae bacterium]